MEEQNVEEFLRDQVKEMGGRAWKFVSPGTNGVPDRLVLLPGGRAVFVEVKAKNGKLSKIQELRIKQLRELGFQAECLNTKAKIKKFLRGMKV